MAANEEDFVDFEYVDDEVFILESPTAPEERPQKRRKMSGGRVSGEVANIWRYFEYKPVKDASLCLKCHKYIPKRDIGNNVKHLKTRHRPLYEEYMALQAQKGDTSSSMTSPTTTPRTSGRQLTLQEAHERSSKYHKDNPRQLQITLAIARLFAAHSLPLVIADCPIWREFLFTVDRRYVASARDGMRRIVLQESERLRQIIQAAITDVRKLSVCVDLWSKKSLTSSFVGLTAHFFSNTHRRLVRVFLAVAEIEGAHKAEVIATIVDEVFASWGIEQEKVRCLVTDSGSNVVKAFRDVNEQIIIELEDVVPPTPIAPSLPSVACVDRNLEDEAAEDDEEFQTLEATHYISFGRQKRIACFAHHLVNALRRTIEASPAYDEILKRSMELVRSFTTSTRRVGLLVEKAGKRLISPVRTRWLYSFYMLERMVELKDALEKISAEDDLEVSLSLSQWRQVETLVAFLREFAMQVTYLEGEQYATITCVIPALLELIEHCNEFRTKQMFSTMAGKVADELRRRFSVVLDPTSYGYQPIFSVSTLLDPVLRETLKVSEQYEDAREELIRMCRVLTRDTEDTVVEDVSSESVTLNVGSKTALFRRVFEKLNNTRIYATAPSPLPVSDEVDRYLNEQSDLCAVDYWLSKSDMKQFPTLCQVAWDVLSVPATSAPIERIFSHAGIASGGRRSRINADLLNAELQMKLNFFMLQ